MGIKPITIGEKYRNIIPEPEKANPLPIQPKKKTNVSSSKSAPVKKEEAPPSPLVKNADGSMRLDFSKMQNSNISVRDSYEDEPQPTQQKRKRKSSNTVEIADFDVNNNKSDRPLNLIESNEPIEKKYTETNNILRSAIIEIDRSLNDLQEDIRDIRSSKTMRSKYTYLSNMQAGVASLIGNKIAAARELNNTIGKCNDFELKRYKEVQAANAASGDEDANVMKMYQAFMATPVSSNPLPNISAAAINSGIQTNGINLASDGQDMGFNSYMNNLTPQQNMMQLERDPNIKEVVVYNQENGSRYFDIIDMRTGQHVPNTEPMDPMFLEDITIDLKNKIARNINLGESYPLIVVGQPIMSEF